MGLFDCKTCKVLQDQLEHERAERKALIERHEKERASFEASIMEAGIRAEDSLKIQLGIEQKRANELQNHILHPPKPDVRVEPLPGPQPVTPKNIPWRIKQQMLEQEARKQAQIIKDLKTEEEQLKAAQENDELEKEVQA